MGVTVPLEGKLSGEAFASLLRTFSLPEGKNVRFVNSSHGEDDLRHNYIIDNAYVLRANSQPVMTDARLCELNSLIDRYRAFGLLAPRFLPAANGHYTAEADGMHCYVSEYLDAPLADDKKATCRSALIAQRLELVCRFAAHYRGEELSETRAMYSLFKLAPYDEPYGIDEKQSNFNDLTASLRESGERELAAALERRYGEIRARLRAMWDALPECFFQGDENFSNLCVDENGRIIGLFDFNMAGTDVIANYLACKHRFSGQFLLYGGAVHCGYRTGAFSRHYGFLCGEHRAHPRALSVHGGRAGRLPAVRKDRGHIRLCQYGGIFGVSLPRGDARENGRTAAAHSKGLFAGRGRTMNAWKRLDERLSARKGRTLWQFVKFNLVSLTVTILQLLLANLLPLAFDGVVSPLPPLLRGIFRAETLFPDGSKYVVNGVVTWGYVLPFLLANGLANIYGYFINMKTTFRGKGTRAGFAVYLAILFALILFATWMQGAIVAAMAESRIASLSRTLASFGAGVVQTAVLFPLEKLVLFRPAPDGGKETT